MRRRLPRRRPGSPPRRWSGPPRPWLPRRRPHPSARRPHDHGDRAHRSLLRLHGRHRAAVQRRPRRARASRRGARLAARRGPEALALRARQRAVQAQRRRARRRPCLRAAARRGARDAAGRRALGRARRPHAAPRARGRRLPQLARHDPALPLADALRIAPPRAPARARADARWRTIHVDARAGTVARPPGLRLDTGGTAKGLLADVLARRLWGLGRVAIDCAGDVRIAGRRTRASPQEIEVGEPVDGGGRRPAVARRRCDRHQRAGPQRVAHGRRRRRPPSSSTPRPAGPPGQGWSG